MKIILHSQRHLVLVDGHKEQKRGEAIFELRGEMYRPSVAATENDCCFICYIDDLYISPCESSDTVK